MELKLYNQLPSLDLHGETKEISIILVKEFIEDNYQLKNTKIKVIHGIGKSILKNAVHQELKQNKFVKDYKLNNFNPGETIIELKL